MKKEYCSYCMNEIKTDERYYKCRRCDNVFKVEKLKNPYLECPKCKRVTEQRWCIKCNKESCIISEKDIVISILGTPKSGKTTFIVSLINDIILNGLHDRNLNNKILISVPKNNFMLYEFIDLYKRNFNFDNLLIRATDSLYVTMKLSFLSKSKQKDIYVNIYDGPLGGWTTESEIAMYYNRLAHSSAVIFCSTLNEYLYYNPIDNIHNLNARLREVLNVKNYKKIKIPVAIVCSKLDQVNEYDDIVEKYSKVGPLISKEGEFIKGSCDDINDIMKPILEKYNGHVINMCNCLFENYQIFGISAVMRGHDNDIIKRVYYPFRIKDPFLWILYSCGVIK